MEFCGRENVSMSPFAHASISLMAKPAFPTAPLLAMLAATQVPDLLFFAFEAAGIEHQAVTELTLSEGITYLSPASLAFSHGFLMCIVWSVLAATIAYVIARNRRISAIVALMVMSHWLLDFIVYNNLPIFLEGSPEVGLGLVTSGAGFIGGMALEFVLIVAGIVIYLFSRRRRIMAGA
jgi:membrane-bound metal-dependent hydrolase YbcI (DUF457 family)